MQFWDGERESVETNVFIWECSETGSGMVMMRCISRVVRSEQFPGSDHTLVSESERHYNYGAREQFLIPHSWLQRVLPPDLRLRGLPGVAGHRHCRHPAWVWQPGQCGPRLHHPENGQTQLGEQNGEEELLIDQCSGCCWPDHLNLFLSTSDYKSWISSEKYLLPAVIMVSLVLIFHQKSPRTWDPRRTNYD